MDTLKSLIAAEALQPVDLRVAEFARAIIAPFGETARSVIFYGSCLREAQLDGLMLDFYVIVSDYAAAYRAANKAGWMARANALIPPNVFPAAHGTLAAKYAVLSEADLARACSMQAGDVSVWARFAQPVRIVWSADAAAEAQALDALCAAPVTLLRHAAPVADSTSADPLHIWRTGFTRTYAKVLELDDAAIVDAVRAELADGSMRRTVPTPGMEPGDPGRVPSAGLAWAIDRFLAGFDLYRFFWHPALLRLSLFACLFGALALSVYR